MKSLCLCILVFTALVFAQTEDDSPSCYYGPLSFYPLEGYPFVGNFSTDSNGNLETLWFGLCGALDSIQCNNETAVCVLTEGSETGVSYGTWEGALFSDMANSQGIELTYGPGESCGTDKKFKTVLQITCDAYSFMKVLDVQRPTDCDVLITATSTYACYPMMDGGSDMRPQPTSAHIAINGLLLSVLLFLLIVTICLACCTVCFCVKNKKCEKKKKEQEMSHIAFQPLQQTPQFIQQPTQFVQQPSFQPMYFMMQPQVAPTQQVTVQVDVAREQQQISDEDFARQLQAQFNSEMN